MFRLRRRWIGSVRSCDPVQKIPGRPETVLGYRRTCARTKVQESGLRPETTAVPVQSSLGIGIEPVIATSGEQDGECGLVARRHRKVSYRPVQHVDAQRPARQACVPASTPCAPA